MNRKEKHRLFVLEAADCRLNTILWRLKSPADKETYSIVGALRKVTQVIICLHTLNMLICQRRD